MRAIAALGGSAAGSLAAVFHDGSLQNLLHRKKASPPGMRKPSEGVAVESFSLFSREKKVLKTKVWK